MKMIYGKNGWLFLHNDTNAVIDQITGKRPFSSESLKKWADAMKIRKEYAAKNACEYEFLIIPNKHCVYDEFLPDGISLSDNRRAIQLSKLGDPVVYPLDHLKQFTKDVELYYKNDTHWNSVGAAVVFNDFAKRHGIPHTLDISPKNIRTITFRGDLGNKVTPNIISSTHELRRVPTPNTVFHNLIQNTGKVFVLKGIHRHLPRAVIFGDSFTRMQYAVISSFFSHVFFFHAPTFDSSVLDVIRPDIILSCHVERFLNMTFLQDIPVKQYILQRIECKATAQGKILFAGYHDYFSENDARELIVASRQVVANRILNVSDFSEIYHFSVERCVQSVHDLIENKIDCHEPYWILFMKLLEAGRIDECIRIAKTLLAPGEAFATATEVAEGGHFDDAETLRAFIESVDNQDAYCFEVGRLFFDRQDYLSATSSFRRAVALSPDTHKYHLNLSKSLNELGHTEEAIASMLRAIALDSTNPHCHAYLGTLHMKQKDFKRAEACMATALEMDSRQPIFHEIADRIQIEKRRNIRCNSFWHRFQRWLEKLGGKEGSLAGFKVAVDKAAAKEEDVPGRIR